MCMTTYVTRCLVADKPITCYKVMRLINYGSAMSASAYKFRSEYRGYIYTLGEEYSLRYSEYFPEANPDGRRMIVEKGFHSYVIPEDAHHESMRNTFGYDLNPMVMVKCEIPKGARYWTGDEGGYAGYCSDCIKVVAWKRWHDKDWTETVPPAGAV